MKVSFVVPMYNARDTIVGTLNSIYGQEAEDFEVIVVDDGSTDGSAEEVKGTGFPVMLISKPNRGEASALNEGIGRCRGEFVAIVEADVELLPGWLSILLKEFEDPEVMGAGGYLMTPKEDPWIARLAGYEVEMKFEGKQRYPPHITSAAAIYRRRAFELFGGFDEGLRNASLDSDFNLRIVRGGYKLAYNPRARARHHYKPRFFSYLKRNYAYARYRPYVKGDLYPADRFLRYNVGFCGLAVASLALLPRHPWVPFLLIPAALLLQVPVALKMWRRHGDPACFIYPFIAFVRNIVASVGYVWGIICLRFGR
ncbi:MAG: hypothetical protein DRQ14_06615 [Candidatus Latescibacterota bacterium]|nr:MAG: hypothetical protein DRQ14_06615 [Candidatus Latescibacterota bacterium]